MKRLFTNSCEYLLNRKSVSTWSPLATIFNHKTNPRINFSLINNEVGLFNKKELTNYGGFYLMKDNAIQRSEELVDEALNPHKTRPIVDIFDELSDTLCKVADLSEFIRMAHPKAKYRFAAEEACISISGFVEQLNTHKPLYDALLNSVKDGKSGDDYVAKLFMFDFEQSGIHLDSNPRERVVKLNDTILQIGQRFMTGAASIRHVPRQSVPNYISDQFKGSDYITASGFQVENSDALAREAAYRIYLAPDDLQDLILSNLLAQRLEMAKLCGFECYADRAIKGNVMETTSNVKSFLDILSEKLKPFAQEEFHTMLDMKIYEESNNSKLQCWDAPYYSMKAKMQLWKGDGSEYSSYFSLGSCMEGFNLLLQSIYGISLHHEDMLPGESWSPDVYKLAVIDESNQLLGHIYCDFYERANKSNQDCHFTIQGGKLLPDGTYQTPIVVVMLSLNCGNWGGPALLSPGSVDNLFHEMGHAMHSMLGRAKYQHVSGTRCPTDLAEVPSILMEYFASDPAVLRLFAKHFQTKESMPESMIHRLCVGKCVFGAIDMQQQVFYSVLDQQYHSAHPFGNHLNSTNTLKDIQKKYYGLSYVENTAWQHRFNHLVGYGAKYYSYLISHALAWSSWRKKFINNPLSRSGGEWVRNELLCHGGSVPCQSIASNILSPLSVTPESLANELIEELDYHKDYLKRWFKIQNK